VSLVIFDLDGTLVDSLEDLYLAVAAALREHGLPPRSREEVLSYIGEGAARLVGRAVAPADHLLEPVLASWRAHYQEHLLDHTRLYPGMAPVLASATVPMAVHSNKPGAMARRILDGLGVRSRFLRVVGGDDAPRKPDPTGALSLMREAGATAEETVLVGDSGVDLATAAAAGIRFLPVSWGFVPPGDLARLGATGFLQDPSELLPWVQGR
jgi:phosphoglycolate phosphatase